MSNHEPSEEYLILINERIVNFELICPKNHWAGLCPILSKEMIIKIFGAPYFDEFVNQFDKKLDNELYPSIPALFLVYQKIKSLSLPLASSLLPKPQQQLLQSQFLVLCSKAINLLKFDDALENKSTPIFAPPTNKYETSYGNPIEYVKAMTNQYLEILPIFASYNALHIKMLEILKELNIPLDISIIPTQFLQTKDIYLLDKFQQFDSAYPLEACLGVQLLKKRTEFLDVLDDSYFLKHLVSPLQAQLDYAQNQILNVALLPWKVLVGLKSNNYSGAGSGGVYFISPPKERGEGYSFGESIDKSIRFYNDEDLNSFIKKHLNLNYYGLENYAVLEFSDNTFSSITTLSDYYKSSHEATPSLNVKPSPTALLDFIASLSANNIKNKLNKALPISSNSSNYTSSQNFKI